jgi:hypothetical protein
VELSRAGRALWDRLEGELLDIGRAVLRALSPAQREGLIRAIRLL